jgi:NAD(P)-dependent dehydrogenase (short-subunit alcohol dehydrogenase family)
MNKTVIKYFCSNFSLCKRFTNQTVIVTGGAMGIGKATSLRLADEGANLIIADFNEEEGDNTIKQIIEKYGKNRAKFINVDISNEYDAERLAKYALKEYGQIDVLVNNASKLTIKGFDSTKEEFEEILKINVVGTYLVSKHVSDSMKKNKSGSIVNLSSITGQIAQEDNIIYSASKAAIAQLTRNMALDLSPYNIRVNAVAPGAIITPGVYSLLSKMNQEQMGKMMAFTNNTMLKRGGQPEEIASCIAFLASNDASYITGTILHANGGFNML